MRGLEQDYRNPVPVAPPRNLQPSTNRARFVDDVDARAKESTIEAQRRNNETTANNNSTRPTEVDLYLYCIHHFQDVTTLKTL